MATILITGGSGLIGRALTEFFLEKQHQVIVLTRRIKSTKRRLKADDPNLSFATWNISKQQIDAEAFGRAEVVIHLAGTNVGHGRWTGPRKRKIQSSRVESGKLLVSALHDIPNRVQTVISASAIGWYGPDRGGKIFQESDPSSDDFLGETCRLWEESIWPAQQFGKRVVILRTGIVLARDGGALPAFKRPVRFGIVPIFGTGKQMMSWIHLEDLCRIYAAALENPDMQGVYNAVAPKPASNKQFMTMLGQQVKGNFFITVPVPSFMLRTLLGEMSTEILKSATVSSDKIRQTGFQFLFPGIDSAIGNLVANPK